ncbi:hypothetical protein ACLI09_00405 [Flavobacterium sp. RHBU_24]|uniref:hypothetical protein n=1 Tax=Flavobacterium sp. RHBU_24 TaxID=3391185 RepID=UPI00398539D5
MDLAARKYHFIQELANADENLLDKLESLLRLYKKQTDWADELSDEELAEIDEGIADIENGNVFEHEEVMKLFDKWR